MHRINRELWGQWLAERGQSGNGLSDDELAAAVARVRYPGAWASLLEPLPWEECDGIHRLYAFATCQFGGPRLAERYRDLPTDLRL